MSPEVVHQKCSLDFASWHLCGLVLHLETNLTFFRAILFPQLKLS